MLTPTSSTYILFEASSAFMKVFYSKEIASSFQKPCVRRLYNHYIQDIKESPNAEKEQNQQFGGQGSIKTLKTF